MGFAHSCHSKQEKKWSWFILISSSESQIPNCVCWPTQFIFSSWFMFFSAMPLPFLKRFVTFELMSYRQRVDIPLAKLWCEESPMNISVPSPLLIPLHIKRHPLTTASVIASYRHMSGLFIGAFVKRLCVVLCSDSGQVWNGWEKRHSSAGEQSLEGPRHQRGGPIWWPQTRQTLEQGVYVDRSWSEKCIYIFGHLGLQSSV